MLNEKDGFRFTAGQWLFGVFLRVAGWLGTAAFFVALYLVFFHPYMTY